MDKFYAAKIGSKEKKEESDYEKLAKAFCQWIENGDGFKKNKTKISKHFDRYVNRIIQFVDFYSEEPSISFHFIGTISDKVFFIKQNQISTKQPFSTDKEHKFFSHHNWTNNEEIPYLDRGVPPGHELQWLSSYFNAPVKNGDNIWAPKAHYNSIKLFYDELKRKYGKLHSSINAEIIDFLTSHETVKTITNDPAVLCVNYFSIIPILKEKKSEDGNFSYFDCLPFVHYLWDCFDDNGANSRIKDKPLSPSCTPSFCYHIINGKQIPLIFVATIKQKSEEIYFVNQPLADLKLLRGGNIESEIYWTHKKKNIFTMKNGDESDYQVALSQASEPIKKLCSNSYVARLEREKEKLDEKQISLLDKYLCRWSRDEEGRLDKGHLKTSVLLSILPARCLFKPSIIPEDDEEIKGFYHSHSKGLSLPANLNCFAEFTNPARLLLGVKQILQSQPLYRKEPPLISSSWLEDYIFGRYADINSLNSKMAGLTEMTISHPSTAEQPNTRFCFGINLLTCFSFDEPLCHEDGFVISKSAAVKLAIVLNRDKNKSPVKWKDFKKSSFELNNNEFLLRADKGAGDDSLNVIVNSLEKTDTEIGDKISNRHGWKGVISCIRDDDEMPYIKLDGIAKPMKAEIIVNPYSIIKRLAPGILAEAALGNEALKRERCLSAHPYFVLEDQPKGKYESKEKLLSNILSNQKNSGGFIYWIRLPQTAETGFIRYKVRMDLTLTDFATATNYYNECWKIRNQLNSPKNDNKYLEQVNKIRKYGNPGFTINLFTHILWSPLQFGTFTKTILEDEFSFNHRIS
ncbi:MAG: hypothetical protein JNL74_07955, partial [Fibrobacteres bacterium]|nr:hypothetical protein [Fibrobacterota bacterium]